MEVAQVLNMKGGTGETSYANNSFLQKKVIAISMPIIEEAITNLYCSTFPTSLAIADLGCSSKPNTLFVASELIHVIAKICQKLGHQPIEFQVFLNDLPGNDFNTIFKSLPSFQDKLKKQMGASIGPCFFTGVPGSFYDRLFPTNSLHFVHSSYSVHWLSQVPKGAESNRGNICMASSSPPSVRKAYLKQFQQDFSMFLKHRSEELVAGGRMVLTLMGRRGDDPSSQEGTYIWELMATALNEMVSEGIIEEEKVVSFNIPGYAPSPDEVKWEIEKEGSFAIDRLEICQVNWINASDNDFNSSEVFKDDGYNVAKCIRAVAEKLLVTHFGEAIIDEVFTRYRRIVTDWISKGKTDFNNVIVSMTKMGKTPNGNSVNI